MVYSSIIAKAKQNFGADLNIKSKARELRKNMTKSERILWNILRNRQLNGLHFRRQHPYGIYILDFYCFKTNLVIEIDGLIHLKQHTYDNERTRYLESSGLKVLRFKNKDIENRIEWVLDEIRSNLIESPPSQPSPKGEGAL
jgi:very-short-patch-repair endonuclease